MHFKQPTLQTTISAEDKERRRLYIQELNRQSYRRLAEGADTTGTLIPQLINYFLRRQKTTHSISAVAAAEEIRNLY